MTWQGIEGHDSIVEYFRRLIARGRLASTFLFVGPPGVGKRLFAARLAKALLCEHSGESSLEACGECASCKMVEGGTHPDLIQISKPADRSFLPVKLFIGEDDKRMQEGLCHAISLKPFMGGRRIAIIDDADYLNAEGANCLLKTLEEPPPQSLMILIGTSPDRQLSTILSRSQVVRFGPLSETTVANILRAEGVTASEDDLQLIAKESGGSLEAARALADADLRQFRKDFTRELGNEPFQSVTLARQATEFIDAAGKEASERRARGRKVVEIALDHYRDRLRRLIELEAGSAERLDEESLADCIERCIDALAHIDRNANQAVWLECWLDDLGQRTASTEDAGQRA